MSVTHIFVNLPVADIEASKRFYAALGFGFNPDFSDENSAYIVVTEHIVLQLASPEKFQGFTNREIPPAGSSILALGVESREEVDRLADTALQSGGSSTRDAIDLGWLYNRAFVDPDGHPFEAVHLDAGAMS
ncbi:glyoxalase [Microbacterium resistens]|uniref:Glyoxalase n=1 Tax=Microbacterium resistens TaxID=156977 RepID=A0ABY3RRN3_9MICO|nr:VOC family protein [Microbacterium resistens]UGS26717.1 glyoxalase [Microbacterium resistens]